MKNKGNENKISISFSTSIFDEIIFYWQKHEMK